MLVPKEGPLHLVAPTAVVETFGLVPSEEWRDTGHQRSLRCADNAKEFLSNEVEELCKNIQEFCEDNEVKFMLKEGQGMQLQLTCTCVSNDIPRSQQLVNIQHRYNVSKRG